MNKIEPLKTVQTDIDPNMIVELKAKTFLQLVEKVNEIIEAINNN